MKVTITGTMTEYEARVVASLDVIGNRLAVVACMLFFILIILGTRT